ncbi:hypothetical protein Hdeb2414_s0015g00444161 [Helianthus debilis subsp. tardiflorus]
MKILGPLNTMLTSSGYIFYTIELLSSDVTHIKIYKDLVLHSMYMVKVHGKTP